MATTHDPSEAGKGVLDWQQFSARFFPQNRRHDLKAVAAYGAYRHQAAREGQDEGSSVPQNGGASAPLVWESEGGTPGSSPTDQEQEANDDVRPTIVH